MQKDHSFHVNGLRILLVNRILLDGKTVAGVTTLQDGYINIFLGLGSFYTLNVHHELWHAIEFRTIMDKPDAFANWSTLNPIEFQYSYDLNIGDIWDHTADGGEWFVRGYSRISPEEDRATVIEATFLYDREWWTNHPRIKAKLDVMLSAVKSIFGDIYFYGE